MNTAGKAVHFYPSIVKKGHNGELIFEKETEFAYIESFWSADPKFASDLIVEQTLTAKKDGYFSLATPALITVKERELTWGILPGYFQGAKIQRDFPLAYAYGQGIPAKPVVVRERTASTLAPILTANGISMTVIPDPSLGRDPWENKNTQSVWRIGLSLMSRKEQLSPTLYYPVLGEKGSFLKKGDKISYKFRYSIQQSDWFAIYKHAIYDVFKFSDFLALKKTQQSLVDRVLAMKGYLSDDKTSLWRTEEFSGIKIGAQSYMSGVAGSDNDAMKNSDYGAMWMLANITNDSVLRYTRLPYARNFKLSQQEVSPGFFHGAAIGQYYLWKSKKFTEEWGTHVEPISLTYYMMLDIGNILLFNPRDKELRERLRMAADRLLAWQHPDGDWNLAYDRLTNKGVYTDLLDLRPTFYGMIVAYRIFGEQKYLDAAVKGAKWFVKEAVEKGSFTGVCGDVRFVNDFATGQSAQALLDLYELTRDKEFLNAAVNVARIYTASVYTHPIPTTVSKLVNGKKWEDWQISQVGLSFEHGGTIGSANGSGPILLASHAGMFLRIFQLTGDVLFRDMARAAALGRDAFVDPKTNVVSYYWARMNNGPGPFPHHAWWQVGWIMDYLISEAAVRSGGRVHFPGGFITPKVGPHKTYGFAGGDIYGHKVDLFLIQGLFSCGNPNVDYITARSEDKKKLFVVLLNEQAATVSSTVKLDLKVLGVNNRQKGVYMISAKTGRLEKSNFLNSPVSLPGFGIKVFTVELF
jgi:beta-L-arabinofuranosidase (glycosyl hydrolase family 127)